MRISVRDDPRFIFYLLETGTAPPEYERLFKKNRTLLNTNHCYGFVKMFLLNE